MSDGGLEAALEDCASEPVHTPGQIQPCGCVLAIDMGTDNITHVSANTDAFIGSDPIELLGRPLRGVLGRDLSHAIRNALAGADAFKSAIPLGIFDLGGLSISVSVSRIADSYLVELEHEIEAEFEGADRFQTLSYLIKKIGTCGSQQRLFDVSTNLLRALSNYDRVVVYKFDRDFNGVIVAEDRRPSMDPLLGLRFPHWDIPAQARAMMAKLPLRFIEDADQVPVPLLAQTGVLPPLDISLALTRGVSPVHMEYLRNAGFQATMTLSIVVEGELWGMISFHHGSAKVPPQALRAVLMEFAEVFAVKLQALVQKDRLQLISKIDGLNMEFLDEVDENLTMRDAIPTIAPGILQFIDAQGLATYSDSKPTVFGQVPEEAVLTRLFETSQAEENEISVFENLSGTFPELASSLNGCAGAVVVTKGLRHGFCIFRQSSTLEIKWAGNPEKTIGRVDGAAKLSPRASFSSYLEMVEDRCTPWSEENLYFAKRVWALVSAAEQRVLKNTISRQQALMINELNHRVRNILALVRSVSEQSRRRYGSLNAYAASLESRIQALATAHDMTSGNQLGSVSVIHLIKQEIDPFVGASIRADVIGEDVYLRAQDAPIFSLIIHEMATNAAKYGALSVADGALDVTLTRSDAGLAIAWSERNGPVVQEPSERGFGTALIEQAAPYEFGGTATLKFEESGVQAEIFLPVEVLEAEPDHIKAEVPTIAPQAPSEEIKRGGFSGTPMVLEDNFVIAKDLSDLLEECGFDSVEMVSGVKAAQSLLTSFRPELAILDINLGPDATSEPIALQLLEMGVPFLFLTGYGDQADLGEALRDIPILTKPVSKSGLMKALSNL